MGRSDGAGEPAKCACTASAGNSETGRPRRAHVATAGEILSHRVRPVSPRVPCVILRSVTANLIAPPAGLFVGSITTQPGVVTNVKHAAPMCRDLSVRKS